jgi:prolipoprotein diacylglyceryl transferase
MLASIPSPSISVFEIGPLNIHIYGILMGIAVATAYVLTVRRYEKFGGDRATAESAGFWAIVIGFVGARFAFVLPRLGDYSDNWLGVFRIWEGGIALFGGLTFGTVAALFVVHRRHGDLLMFADSVAVALPAAQAIGRWGNYFNQELFGTPTSLPWGLEIDPENRPRFADGSLRYPGAETFHPTFLYEMLWNIGLIVLLVWLERHRKLRRGTSIALYMILYSTARFLLELIRTDSPYRFWGLSRNGWYSLLVIGAGLALLWWIYRRRPAAATTGVAAEIGEAGEPAGEEPAAEAQSTAGVEIIVEGFDSGDGETGPTPGEEH